MRNLPIKLQFIIPRHASPASKSKYRHLKKLISGNNTIHLHLTPSKEVAGEFVAHISIKEPACDSPEIELNDLDMACESDIRRVSEELLKNPLAKSLGPAQRIYAVMSGLNKPVRLQTLCQICYETLKLSPETIRGTLNKKRSLYLSPKHGIWCTMDLGKQMGWLDCR